MNLIAQYKDYYDYNYQIGMQPHGDPHLYIGGIPGEMSTMNSPDDFLFWLHHCNMDRFWALWQDCYDYDKVDPSQITNSIFSYNWTVGYGSNIITYTIDEPMLYYYPSTTIPATRLTVPGNPNPFPRPRDMHFIGNQSKLGYGGIYYRYGPDQIVATMNSESTFDGICHFDTLCNVLPTQKRSFTLPDNIFDDPDAQQHMERIESLFGVHSSQQKLHYLALWECSNQNIDQTRNHTAPFDWCEMNGHNCSDWMTTCQREGYTEGYDDLAWLEHDEYLILAILESPYAIPVGVTFAVLIVLGVGAAVFYHRRKNQQFERVGGEIQEPLVDE